MFLVILAVAPFSNAGECERVQLVNLRMTGNVFQRGERSGREIFSGRSNAEFGLIYSQRGTLANTTVQCLKNDGLWHDLQVQADVEVSSVGATFAAVYVEDFILDVDNFQGKKLKDLCGAYGGVKVGLGWAFGVNGMLAINQNRVVLRTTGLSGSVLPQVDLSYAMIRVRCKTASNPPIWEQSL